VFHPPHGADPAEPLCGVAREGINASQGTSYPRPCGVPTAQPSSQELIKRVVGRPGDRIAIRNGHVIRNGAPVSEPYAEPCGGGPLCTFPEAIVVPRGDYFMLGDNRGESDDSRFWGPVPKSWMLGKVVPG
jgi:signal peptidase I